CSAKQRTVIPLGIIVLSASCSPDSRGSKGAKDAGLTTNDAQMAQRDGGVVKRTPRILGVEPVQITSWKAHPVGSYIDACSGQGQKAGGSDTWCAFFSFEPLTESVALWVANVTKIAAHGARCDRNNPTNPDCLRLTIDAIESSQP